jgi:hypothetical protein
MRGSPNVDSGSMLANNGDGRLGTGRSTTHQIVTQATRSDGTTGRGRPA